MAEGELRKFWSVAEKAKFERFRKRPVIPGGVVNLERLDDSHCKVSVFLHAQKLSLLLRLCGMECYEEAVRMFYANLLWAGNNEDLESFVLGVRIVINSRLFKEMFGCEFSGDIPYMNGNWPKDFEVSLEEARAFISEEHSDSLDFGPLTFCFEHRILAHIVATTLVPRKGSLNSVSNRDVFIPYCLLKKYRINWDEWIREYMLESAEASNPTASLPYGLLISRMLIDSQVDLSGFKATKVSATYDSSMGYTLIDNKWHKNSVKGKAEIPKSIKISADSVAILTKEVDDLKASLSSLTNAMQGMQETLTNILQLKH